MIYLDADGNYDTDLRWLYLCRHLKRDERGMFCHKYQTTHHHSIIVILLCASSAALLHSVRIGLRSDVAKTLNEWHTWIGTDLPDYARRGVLRHLEIETHQAWWIASIIGWLPGEISEPNPTRNSILLTERTSTYVS
jgi:hypothetical protein